MLPEKVRVQPTPLLAKIMYDDLIRDHAWEAYEPLKRTAGQIDSVPPEIGALFKYFPTNLHEDSVEASLEARKRSSHTFVGSFKFYPSANRNVGIEIRITTSEKRRKNKIYVGTFRRTGVKDQMKEVFRTRRIKPEDKTAVENYLQNGISTLMELFPKETKNVTRGW